MIIITPSQTIAEWTTATFSVLTFTTGSTNLTNSFQWYNDNFPVLNGTTSVLIIPSATALNNGGLYNVLYSGSVSSSLGTTVIGSSASLSSSLYLNPVVVTNPTSSWGSQVAYEDATIVLGGEIISSSIPVSYQWFRNNSPIAGATGATYTISGQSYENMVGVYSVTGTTASGSAATNGFGLSVFPPGIDPSGGQQTWNPYKGGYWQTM